ncbi:MAG: hypothetical protein JO366_18830 [Methylobacteriaceae bacterium]|nr:hypothetical protein [Methylobacteriaceae bacterium]MBV9246858.1 hypothetical protein [Methylobacteriaceae bacterium]MBV9635886.1 hypothetical protein [Methylobacteriaceae bacterium]MBV9705008.1 hypothetical protein [Methylobacteriaceae bacterium]
MKNVLLGAAVGLVSLMAYLPNARADQSMGCQSAEVIKSQADIGSAKHGGRALRLDGPDAAKFLDYLNNRIGDPTDYKGDSLIIGLYPDLGYVLIGFIVNGCADQNNLVKLDADNFMRAYHAARGVSV